MEITYNDLLLVTGATGLVGSHVVRHAHERRIRTRVLVRQSSDTGLLDEWGVEQIVGDMTDCESLKRAVDGSSVIVHCAAKVGDWGRVDDYRTINVRGLENLLEGIEAAGSVKRFIQISSLGVYEARDHFGTDETEQPTANGIDGYTLTKVESEQLVVRRIRETKLPATILRPGFIYGPRDRTVLPRLLKKLKEGRFAFLGSGETLMNNTYVGNLVDAIFAAVERDVSIGQTYNITDGWIVSKKEFITTIAQLAGYPIPTRKVPLPLARILASVLEKTWHLLGKQEAPLLSQARIKFLGLNLDFCIDKARRELEYHPQVEFADGMRQTIDWFREQGMIERLKHRTSGS